jgi:biofilm PGA synthesis lipoprotein PgaB
LIAFLNGRGSIPDNAVLITFDNGYQSFCRTVFPLLMRYHDPVTLFAIVSWLHPSRSPDKIHRLTWTEVERMYATGLLDVQSQTFDLHKAVAVSPTATQPASVGRAFDPATGRPETWAQYDAHALSDLRRARTDLLQHLHEPAVNAMAYPFGDYTPRFIRLAHEAGYRYLFTATYGWGILPHANPDYLFRLNAGYPGMTPADLISTIKWIGGLTARGGPWTPPPYHVEIWP